MSRWAARRYHGCRRHCPRCLWAWRWWGRHPRRRRLRLGACHASRQRLSWSRKDLPRTRCRRSRCCRHPGSGARTRCAARCRCGARCWCGARRWTRPRRHRRSWSWRRRCRRRRRRSRARRWRRGSQHPRRAACQRRAERRCFWSFFLWCARLRRCRRGCAHLRHRRYRRRHCNRWCWWRQCWWRRGRHLHRCFRSPRRWWRWGCWRLLPFRARQRRR